MKHTNKFISIASFFMFCQLMFPNISKADNKPIIIKDIVMSNGRSILWGLCEERYKNVYSYDEFKSVTVHGESAIIQYHRLVCEDPGWARCRRTPTSGKAQYHGVYVSDQFLSDVENELISAIENELMINGNFKGRISEKRMVSNGCNHVILLFDAIWFDGDANGNGNILIKVFDITDDINIK